jgi:hypothetical protein
MLVVARARLAAMLDQPGGPHVVMHRQAASQSRDRQRVEADGTDRVVDPQIRNLHASRPPDQEALGGVQLVNELSGHTLRVVAGPSVLPLSPALDDIDVPRIADEVVDAADGCR